MATYKFRNLKTIEDKKFEATDFLDALNQASREWFDGVNVTDWQPSGNGQITLLGNSSNGNVIGRIYDHQI